MYDVDEYDTVVELNEIPRPDIGAPLPLVLSDEHHLLLAYLVSRHDPQWDGSYCTVVRPETPGLAAAIIRFHIPYAHMFGPPNDEAFEGHPLEKRGLSPYAVFEVKQSSWIRRLERMNSVHPHHNRERFMNTKRHWIFAFHNTTFECVSAGLEVELMEGSLQTALDRMAALLVEAWT